MTDIGSVSICRITLLPGTIFLSGKLSGESGSEKFLSDMIFMFCNRNGKISMKYSVLLIIQLYTAISSTECHQCESGW